MSVDTVPQQPVLRIGQRTFLRGLRETALAPVTHRYILYVLATRDIRVRYKQTVLGFSWAILQPVTTAALLSAVLGGQFRDLSPSGSSVPYGLFVLSGLIPWMLIAHAISAGGNSLLSNQPLVTKVRVPRVIVPLAVVIGGAVDALVGSSVLFALTAWQSRQGHTAYSFWIPGVCLAGLLTFVIASAVAVLFSAMAVLYRDLRHVLPFVSQVWLLATPIIYPLQAAAGSSWLAKTILALNPMTYPIESLRWSLWHGSTEAFPLGVLACCAPFLLFGAALMVFEWADRSMADVI